MTPVPANPVPTRAPHNSNSAVKFIFFFIIALALGATILLLRQDQGDWTPPPEARLQKNPVQVNESTVAGGEALYKARCANCHGESGNGNGEEAARYRPVPADLTNPRVGNQTEGELFWKITNGRRPMPSFRNKLSDEERWEVVIYLRTLPQSPSQPR
jgi:mono/diheme cytochrome c family protein